MITVRIDETIPCLKDTLTGENMYTEVVRVTRESLLSRFNENVGWQTNWASLLKDCEVYALVLSGTMSIQGMVAIKKEDEAGAAEIVWMCAAPENTPEISGHKKYIGVGAQLFSIATGKSVAYGFGGTVTGTAGSSALMEHYCETLGVSRVASIYPYRFILPGDSTKNLLKGCSPEWTDAAL